MKKRILSLLICLSLAASAMSGCKSDSGNTETQSSQQPASTQTGSQPAADSKDDDGKETVDSASWASESIGYEIFVRSFYDSDGDGIGDFNGIAQKVDYLKELNIGFVWLMPIMESTTYHGYDIVDYYSVNPDYGTMEDFEEMVQVLHDNGIRVIIDYVANHTSSSNEWFTTALSDSTSKYRDYYFISEDRQTDSGWRKDADSGLYYYGLYDSIMPDLNYNNEEVREEMKNVAAFWLEKGVDGFRLDGSCNIDDDEAVTHDWWQEFTAYVKDINPAAFIVGENWLSSMTSISSYYADMDSSFNFPYTSYIEEMAKGSFVDILSILYSGHEEYLSASQSTDVMKECIDSVMIGNHDMDRIASKLGSTEKAKLAAALQMTLPGTPFIYYGDELGQLGDTTDDNRREPMDWYTSASGDGMTEMTDFWFNSSLYTIANDGISYEEEKDDSESILNYYRKLTTLRTENPVFYTGEYSDTGISDGLFSYVISDAEGTQKLMVMHNLTDSDKSIVLECDGTELMSADALTSGSDYTIQAYGTIVISFTGGELPYTNPYDPPASAVEKEYELEFFVTLPENTPADENIYITGTFNEWNECDENYIMERVDDTHCQIKITVTGKETSALEYKFTRGSWDMREQDSEGADLIGDEHKQNRYYYFTDTYEDTVNLVIEKWSDID